MAIWIEFRCEARTEDFAMDSPPGSTESRCWSNAGYGGPQDLTGETQADVVATYRRLEKDAKATGWWKTKAGWVCPGCAKYMREHDIPVSALSD